MRLLRQENFSPGYYQFSIQGDDGIRLSLDGGSTWILDAFLEQTYASSLRSTTTAYPNGICLSGPTDIVIEYFQRPADARLTFTSTLVSAVTFNQPTAQAICENANTSFTLGTASASLNYQWQVSTDGGVSFGNLTNGGVYSGVTTSTLNLTNVPLAMSGNIYQCVITTTCQGNFTTGQASLSVSSSPTFSSQPTNQAWCAGQNIVFSASANGSGISYQWQVSTNGGTSFSNVSNNAVYSGATSNTLTLTGATASYVGYQYQLLINGCLVQQTSSVASIISGGTISITQQPIPLTVCQGDPATLSVTATGGSSYQWQVDGGSGFINVINGNGYTGAQTATLSLIGAATSINGQTYQCIVSGGCAGNVTTTAAVITVNSNTGITQQAQNQTICAGQNATFTIVAGGIGLSFQWQISTDGGATYSNVTNTAPFSGATTTSLIVTSPASTFDGALFRCVVSGTCGSSQNSNPKTLTITSVPVVQTSPSNLTVCEGAPASFSAIINGTSVFQWQISTDGGASFNAISNAGIYSGATTNQLTISAADISLNTYQYQLTADGCGVTVNSSPATLTVSAIASIEVTQAPEPVCPGEDVTLSVNASNAVSLQWQLNTNGTWVDVLNGGAFNGATQSTLNISNVPAYLQNALFHCVATGACGADAVTEDLLLYLNGIPVLTSQPTSQVACSGGTVSFPLGVQGDGISYQWQIKQADGTYSDIAAGGFFSGVNSSSLQVQGVNEVDGITIRCQLEGCGDALLSDTFRITIYQNDPVYIPSAFSPDGDFINGKFQVYTSGDPILDARIFDRWGEELYHWTDKKDGWDGTFLGVPVQEGVFVYRVVVITACERRTSQGSITVFR